MHTIFAVVVLAAGFAAPDWRERDAAERKLTALCADPCAWSFTRSLWKTSADPEAKPRLQRCWSVNTPGIAAGLLPSCHPYWPSYYYLSFKPGDWQDKLWVENHRDAFREKGNEIAYRWAKENDKFHDYEYGPCGVGGKCGCYHEYPLHWWSVAGMDRDLTRQWAIWKLSYTGDADTIREFLAATCLEERSTWEFRDTHDDGGLKFDAYLTAMIYDPGILNRKYFDGRHDRTTGFGLHR